MAKIAVGFNEDGKAAFQKYLRLYTIDICDKSDKGLQVWFNELGYANWETGENTQIEIDPLYTKSQQPEIYIVPVEHVEFIEVDDAN